MSWWRGAVLVGILCAALLTTCGCGAAEPATADGLLRAALWQLARDIEQDTTVTFQDRAVYRVKTDETSGALRGVTEVDLQPPAKGRLVAELILTGCFSESGDRSETTGTAITVDGGETFYARFPGQPWEAGAEGFSMEVNYERFFALFEEAGDCAFVEDPSLQRAGCRVIRCRPDTVGLMSSSAPEAFAAGFGEEDLAELGEAWALVWVRLADNRLQRVEMEVRIEKPGLGTWSVRFECELTGWGEAIEPPIEAPAL